MGQITTGIRSLLSSPVIYSLFQKILGSEKTRKEFVAKTVCPQAGEKILDIGCGPAAMFKYLSLTEYWGFDISSVYIQHAKSQYGDTGHFFCKELTQQDLEYLPKFDTAIAIGVLHHVSDATAAKLLDVVHQALRPGGRLITLDACYEHGQNPLARLLISWDRGQNVRTREGYTALISGIFQEHQVEVRHSTRIPYTHCYMECRK